MPGGTAASDLSPLDWDSPPAARWQEADLVLLGKTTAPEYGTSSSGLSSFHPLARNPWDPRLNPGGSSAGAGAAAAAVSLNCGFTTCGLPGRPPMPPMPPMPIGLQIAGHRFNDLGVLQLAAAWEQLRGAMPNWPMASDARLAG